MQTTAQCSVPHGVCRGEKDVAGGRVQFSTPSCPYYPTVHACSVVVFILSLSSHPVHKLLPHHDKSTNNEFRSVKAKNTIPRLP